MRLRHVAFGHFGIFRSSDLRPCFTAVACAVKFDAEVAVIQRHQDVSVPRVLRYECAIIANEPCLTDRPARRAPIDRKQTLSRCRITSIAHLNSTPPDSA